MVYLVNLLEWVPILQSEPVSTTSTPAATSRPSSPGSTGVSTPRPEAAHVLIASDGMCLGGLVSAVNSVLSHTRHAVKFYLVTTAEELAHLRSWIEATKLHRMR